MKVLSGPQVAPHQAHRCTARRCTPTNPGNGMSEVAHEADLSRHYKIDASDPKEKSACVPWSKPIACREALEPCGNMIICGRSRTLVTTLSIASLSYWR